jgi:hypothetical protein
MISWSDVSATIPTRPAKSPADNQRMVASCLKWDWQPAKYPVPFVQDWRGFSMHQAIGPDNLSPIDLTYALMAETNA